MKAVELAGRAGEVTLVSLAHEALPPDVVMDGQIIEQAEMSEAIGRALPGQQGKTERVAAAVCGHSSINKIIEVPLMSDEEWAESMDWHAEEHIPFDIADVLLDTHLLSRSEDSQRFLLAVCRREIAEQLKQVIKAAGKQFAIMDLEVLALANCYIYNYEPENDSLVALFDIGMGSSLINLMQGRRSVFARDISLGGEQYTGLLQNKLGLSREQAEEAKRTKGQEVGIHGAAISGVVEALSMALSIEEVGNSYLEVLVNEVQKTFDFYRASSDDPVSVQKILLSGGGSKLNGLAELLSGKFEIPVERLDPFKRIKYDERSFSREQVKEVSPEMAVAVGLALRGVDDAATYAINLLNYEQPKEPDIPKVENRGSRVHRYKARNRLGEIVSGERVAESTTELEQLLRREQLILISSRNEVERLPSLISKFKRLTSLTSKFKRQKVSLRELERFTRWFSFMIDSGLPLIQSLYLLADEENNEYFKDVLNTVASELEFGNTLTAAMLRHPQVFDRQYVSIIEAGETGGVLDIALERLLVSLERTLKWRERIKLAFVYPLTALALLLLIAFVAVINFGSAPAGHKANLLTRALASGGAFLTGMGGVLAVAIVLVSLVSLYIFYRTERGRRRIDKLLLSAPHLGEFLRRKSVARFARMACSLLSTGVPILESLDICAEDARNVVVRDAIEKIRFDIECGHTFFNAMSNDAVFSQLDRTVAGIGEQVGGLDSMLNKLAEFYEKELSKAVMKAPLSFVPFFIVLYVLIIALVYYYR